VLRDLYHLYSKASKKAAKKFDWKIISELYLKRLAEDE
jgi:hypothetical protein